MARYELNFIDRSIGGSKGGSRTSPAKQAASRRNGALGADHGIKGGRPRNRTLAEFLLRRRLTAGNYSKVEKAYREIFLAERPNGKHTELWEFREHHGGFRSPHYQFRKAFNLEEGKSVWEWMKATKYNQHAALGPKTQNYLKAFRSAARQKLGAAVVQAAAPEIRDGFSG